MANESRQQKRRAVRELVKAGEQVVKGGLNPRPPPVAVVALGHVIKAKLDEPANKHRSGQAAQLMHDLMQASLKSFPPRVEIACRRGCNYCCHSFVAVMAPEVFRIADAVRRHKDKRLAAAEIDVRAAALKGVGVEARLGRKLACPLLIDGECSVYAERPLVCRQATSLSVATCLAEFEDPDPNGQVEISAAHVTHASNANVVMMAALIAAGLPHESLELSEALCVALADRDCEAKWLAGENVFAGVQRHNSRSLEAEHAARRIARELAV
jgi:hypothetical protein